MAKSAKSVVQIVWELAEPVAEEIGCWLWDVEYGKEGARRVLRITIDREEGVTIDDCEKMHREMDPILDEADPIEEAYYLEISSPGIERELRTDAHIEACEGWDVEIKLYAPKDGSKLFRGVLMPLDEEGNVRIKAGEEVLLFARSSVAKINTCFEF